MLSRDRRLGVVLQGQADLDGNFAEFEIVAREGEVPLARDCVESLAREVGLAQPEPASYLELLLRQQAPPR